MSVKYNVVSVFCRTSVPSARELFSSINQLPPPTDPGPGMDVLRGQVPELRVVRLEPVAYLGQQLLLDRLCNLVYLPVVTEAPVGTNGGQLDVAGAVQAVQRAQRLHLFGRVTGTGALQRVETPTASALFAAVDVQLKRHRQAMHASWQAATHRHVCNSKYVTAAPCMVLATVLGGCSCPSQAPNTCQSQRTLWTLL